MAFSESTIAILLCVALISVCVYFFLQQKYQNIILCEQEKITKMRRKKTVFFVLLEYKWSIRQNDQFNCMLTKIKSQGCIQSFCITIRQTVKTQIERNENESVTVDILCVFEYLNKQKYRL